MISIYNILNIRIFNFYLTKLSEKIYKYLRKSTKKNELNFLRQTIESLHKTVYYKDNSRPLMWSNLYPDYNLCIQQKISRTSSLKHHLRYSENTETKSEKK